MSPPREVYGYQECREWNACLRCPLVMCIEDMSSRNPLHPRLRRDLGVLVALRTMGNDAAAEAAGVPVRTLCRIKEKYA